MCLGFLRLPPSLPRCRNLSHVDIINVSTNSMHAHLWLWWKDGDRAVRRGGRRKISETTPLFPKPKTRGRGGVILKRRIRSFESYALLYLVSISLIRTEIPSLWCAFHSDLFMSVVSLSLFGTCPRSACTKWRASRMWNLTRSPRAD